MEKFLHVSTRFQIEHDDVSSTVVGAHVAAGVGRFLRPIIAVRTLEPRRLAALVPQVLVQVVLPIEDAGAFRTGESDALRAR